MSVQSRLDVNAVAVAARQGLTDAQIGQMFGVGRMTVLNFRKRYGIAGRPVGPNTIGKTIPNAPDSRAIPIPDTIRVDYRPSPVIPQKEYRPTLVIPPAPFAVPMASPARGLPAIGVTRAFVIPDVHIPDEDKRAVAVAEAIMVAFAPHILVCLGDLIGAGALSKKFPTDPSRMDSLQADIDAARIKLHQWAQLAPQAKRWLLEGNHEQRLTRLIWGLQGAERELAKLTSFQQAMTWPKMLGLDEIGWEWVAYEDQPRDDILPHLLVKHGTFVSPEAGMTAKREWQASGRSGISGHTHRATVWRHKDWNGQATWIEGGTLSRFDVAGANNPNWQQAVTLIEWNEDRSLMNVEQVLIRDGRAMWRGKEYVG